MKALAAQRLVGVSLKMYMDHRQTLDWLRQVAALTVPNGVELLLIPDFLSLYPAAQCLQGQRIALGAQDVCWEDRGAFTGEISAPMLAAAGCSYVEVGHAERRAWFGETDAMVAAKAAAAVRAGLVPLVCIGEPQPTDPASAVAYGGAQLEAVFAALPLSAELVVAYEPVWAIGAAQPAAADYVRTVCRGLRAWLAGRPARLLYGGSAGPGLFGQLSPQVDGLFLGRFAHDPQALAQVLRELDPASAAV